MKKKLLVTILIVYLTPMIIPLVVTLMLYLSWKPDEIYTFLTSIIVIRGEIKRLLEWAGLIFTAVGGLIFLAGLFQIIHTVTKGKGLVKNGLYALVRHPQYLMIALLTLGLILWSTCDPRPIDFLG